jgi:hypothetical protein
MGGPTATSEVRRFLGARLREHADHLVDAVDGGQLYESLGPAEVGEVAGATQRIVEVIAGALLAGTALGRQSERFLRRLGTRRAEQGVPLDKVAAAFRRATRTGLAAMKDAAIEWPEPTAAWDTYVEMTGELFDLVQTATGFVRDGYESWLRGAAADRGSTEASAVEELFEGTWASTEEVIERCRALGHSMTRRCFLVVALAVDRQDTARLRESLLRMPTVPRRGLVVGPLRGAPLLHVPALVAIADDADPCEVGRRVDRWARENGAVVVSEQVEDVMLVPGTYAAVRDDLSLVPATVRTPGRVDRARDLHVPRLLRTVGHEHVEAFVRPSLGGVLARPPTTAEPLLTTLGAVFAWEGDMRDLATALSLSYSGLRSRLSRVAQLTSRHHRRDRVELVLALLLFRIHRLALPPLGDPRWSPG